MGRLSFSVISKGIIAASTFTFISVIGYSFLEMALDKARIDSFQLGQASSMLKLVESNGGNAKAAQSPRVLSQLEAMKGSGFIGYIIVDVMHQRHQVLKNGISKDNPESLYRYDPKDQDMLMLEAANEMSDSNLLEYFKFKVELFDSMDKRLGNNTKEEGDFNRKISMKTNFSHEDIKVFNQCIKKLSKKSVDWASRIYYRNESGGCKKLLYPVMKGYEYQVKKFS
jgi:hypothetical protein